MPHIANPRARLSNATPQAPCIAAKGTQKQLSAIWRFPWLACRRYSNPKSKPNDQYGPPADLAPDQQEPNRRPAGTETTLLPSPRDERISTYASPSARPRFGAHYYMRQHESDRSAPSAMAVATESVQNT